MLAMAKQDYFEKDFFQRKEFRGLLLADYQDAIDKEKADACVDSLNANTVSQFSNLQSVKEALIKRKLLDKFYRQGGLQQFNETKRYATAGKDSQGITRLNILSGGSDTGSM